MGDHITGGCTYSDTSRVTNTICVYPYFLPGVDPVRLWKRTGFRWKKRATIGIASLLLPAGRTAHSRFKIPLDPTDTTYCIPDDDNGLSNLINFIYDDDTLQYPTAAKLQEKIIVCPKNDATDAINAKILSMLSGRTHTYISYDEAIPHGHDRGEVELLYPKEYLNSLSFARLQPHMLELKVGTPIMLLRNLNIVGDLCNGIRLIVTQPLPKVIEARTITGDPGNLPQSSVRKALFESNPKTETSDLTKKAKYDN
nr:DNA helicase [Tanacetum cinerariifolium]